MGNVILSNTEVMIEEKPSLNAAMFESFARYLDASPKTIETYSKALKQFYNYISLNGIATPTREDILNYKRELQAEGKKPTTIQNYLQALSIFFKWTEEEKIYSNIYQHIKREKISSDHKKDALTARQVKKVLAVVNRDTLQGLRDYAILALMFTGGLRTIEVSRANVEDLRNAGEDLALYLQGKGRDEKTEFVKLTAPVLEAIEAYLAARGKREGKSPLFTCISNRNQGGRMTTRSISRIVKETFKKAGYDSEQFTAHSTRHTAVTLALLQGKPLQEVQQFARHRNTATTLIYAHNLEMKNNSCSTAISKAIF